MPWNVRKTWRKYALGTVRDIGNPYRFARWVPMACPFDLDLYLVSAEKTALHVGTDTAGRPLYAEPDGSLDGCECIAARYRSRTISRLLQHYSGPYERPWQRLRRTA